MELSVFTISVSILCKRSLYWYDLETSKLISLLNKLFIRNACKTSFKLDNVMWTVHDYHYCVHQPCGLFTFFFLGISPAAGSAYSQFP